MMAQEANICLFSCTAQHLCVYVFVSVWTQRNSHRAVLVNQQQVTLDFNIT